jgi:hypothetical protein
MREDNTEDRTADRSGGWIFRRRVSVSVFRQSICFSGKERIEERNSWNHGDGHSTVVFK